MWNVHHHVAICIQTLRWQHGGLYVRNVIRYLSTSLYSNIYPHWYNALRAIIYIGSMWVIKIILYRMIFVLLYVTYIYCIMILIHFFIYTKGIRYQLNMWYTIFQVKYSGWYGYTWGVLSKTMFDTREECCKFSHLDSVSNLHYLFIQINSIKS